VLLFTIYLHDSAVFEVLIVQCLLLLHGLEFISETAVTASDLCCSKFYPKKRSIAYAKLVCIEIFVINDIYTETGMYNLPFKGK